MSKVTDAGRQATPLHEREVSLMRDERGMTRHERREYLREIRAGVPHEQTRQGQRERIAPRPPRGASGGQNG